MAHRGGYGSPLSVSQQRQPWSEEEDRYLVSAVSKFGTQRWSQISRGLAGRTSKACSHRWRTYLQPGVKHTTQEPFSDWEVAVVVEAHKHVGNQWSTIARMLPGRTNAAVKNFWYAHTRRNKPGAGGDCDGGDGGDGGDGLCYDGCDDEEEEEDGLDGGEAEEDEEEDGSSGTGYEEAGSDQGRLMAAAAGFAGAGAAAAGLEGAAYPLIGPEGALLAGGGQHGGALSGGGGAASRGSSPRPPLRIKLGKGFGPAALTPPPSDAMLPPRGSAAGGGGSPVLRPDGGGHPSDSGVPCYSACGLQLQGSSQPLMQEQLGLGAAAGGPVAWMRSSGGGRELRQGVSRLGSSSVAAGLAHAGEPFMPLGAAGYGLVDPSAAAIQQPGSLRCSDSSCSGTRAFLQPLVLPLPGAAPNGAALPTVAAPGSPFAAALHSDAALGPVPAFCMGGPSASGRLLSAPSRGLSGLLWEAPGAGGCGLGGMASQELLLEAFRDMQEPEERTTAAGVYAAAQAAPLKQERTELPEQQVQQPSSNAPTSTVLQQQPTAGDNGQPSPARGAEEKQRQQELDESATPGSKRDRAGLPVMLGNPLLWGSIPAAAAVPAAAGYCREEAGVGGAAAQAKRIRAEPCAVAAE